MYLKFIKEIFVLGYMMSVLIKIFEGCYYLMYNCWEMNLDD